jgi:hypothetical protein
MAPPDLATLQWHLLTGRPHNGTSSWGNTSRHLLIWKPRNGTSLHTNTEPGLGKLAQAAQACSALTNFMILLTSYASVLTGIDFKNVFTPTDTCLEVRLAICFKDGFPVVLTARRIHPFSRRRWSQWQRLCGLLENQQHIVHISKWK